MKLSMGSLGRFSGGGEGRGGEKEYRLLFLLIVFCFV